ncbi:MAG: creatininase family protein [Xanthomonadales bacterium]|nr:creatininase family protein [Xanthomonadales bacterium]
MKKQLALLLILLALSVGSVNGQSNFLIEEMTWEEIKAAIDSGTDTVIINIGATEQHGPQIALSSDSITGDFLTEEIARRIGNTLIAPSIRVGFSPHHMYFPGTITVRSEVITQLIIEYVHSLVWHGFRHIVLIPTHGGNFSTVAETGRRLSLLYPYLNIIAFSDADSYINALKSASERLGIPLDVAGSHAGMSETAMALAVRPDLVRMNRATPGFMGDAYGVGEKMNFEGTPGVSSIGVLGDPTVATAEAGRVYLDALASMLTDFVEQGRSQWQLPPSPQFPDGGLAAPQGDFAEGIRQRRSGDFAAAQAFFESRLQSGSDVAEARIQLARTYILKSEYAKAEEIVTPVLSGSDLRARALAHDELAFISLYEGRFKDAIQHKAAAGEILAKNGGSNEDLAKRKLQIGYILTESGQFDAARKAFDQALQFMPETGAFNLDIRHLAALVDVKQGRLHKADNTRREIAAAAFEPGLAAQMRRFYQLDAELRMALGHPADAVVSLPLAIQIYDHPLYREAEARAFIMLDRLDEAEETLLRLVNLTDARLDVPIVFVRAHYLLGTIYEQQGRIQDAAQMYSKFLGFWGESDTSVPEIRMARAAAARIADHQ